MSYTPGPPRLAYSDTGQPSDPAVVLVGGIGTVIASWLYQIRGLTGFRVIAYEHRGTGDSELIDQPTSMSDYAADLVSLLDHLGIGRASMVGLSFGGRVCQTLALEYPERLDRLIVGGTSCGGRADLPSDGRAALRQLSTLDEEGWIRRVIPVLFGSRYRERYPDRGRQLARWRVRHPPEPRGLDRQWEAYAAFDVCDRLGDIRAPTLVIHGTDDGLSPIETGRHLASKIPGARLAVLEGVGHSPNVEDPDVFNKLIRDFLEEGI